jgi:hypothetical protein
VGGRIADLGLGNVDLCRRALVFILGDRRTYDQSVAGLGTGKAQRYFASDIDRFSNRLFDAREIEAVEVVANCVQQRSAARALPVQQRSTGSSNN